jgi:DNA repair ATPase RecN
VPTTPSQAPEIPLTYETLQEKIDSIAAEVQETLPFIEFSNRTPQLVPENLPKIVENVQELQATIDQYKKRIEELKLLATNLQKQIQAEVSNGKSARKRR